MQKVVIRDFKMPNTCGECSFIGHYKDGPYKRDPHCCCELVWRLHKEDRRVDESILDKDCPLEVLHNNVKEWE